MIVQSQIMSRKHELMVSVRECYGSLKVFEAVEDKCAFTRFLNVSGMDFPLKTVSVMEEDVENMHVESAPDKQSGATGPFPPLPSDIEHHVDSFAMDSHSPNSHTEEPALWRCTYSYAYL